MQKTELPDAKAGKHLEAICKALRLPKAPALLEELAAERALTPCWSALAPLIELRAFEEAADDLRARAAQIAVELGCPLIESQLEWAGYDLDEIDEIRSVVDLFHYQDAKLLLFASVLGQALEVGCGGGRGSGRALMRIPAGVPEEMPALELVPEDVDGVLGDCFREIREHAGVGRVADDFRALGRWPRYLQLAWGDARSRDADGRARAATDELRAQADLGAAQLPHRACITDRDLRAAGADPVKVRALVRRFRSALPGLVLDLALFKVQLAGAEDARESPYPIDWAWLADDDYLPGDIDEELRLRAGDPIGLDEPIRASRS
jgi:hypothetical protein